MLGHSLTWRVEDLEPGYVHCLRCQRRMTLVQFVDTPCVPRPREEKEEPQ